MKVLFFGLGSIGQKYYDLLRDNFDYDIFALRSNYNKGDTINIQYDSANFLLCNYYGLLPASKNLWNWNEVDSIKPDVAIITNPTHLHIETAIKCAERGMHLFITKPVDCKSDYSFEHLKNIVQTKGLTSHIAYPLRHLPIVQKLKQEKYQNSTWKFVCHTNLENWREYQTYSAKYAEGGGVLLELSHELDLATYLLGDVLKIRGWTYNLPTTTDAEDVADITLFHENGNTSFHSLNIASKTEERYFMAGPDRYEVKVDDSVFLAQLRYFFDNIGEPKIMNSLFEASKLFNLLMEFRDATTNNNMRQEG